MSFLKKLASLFTFPTPSSTGNFYTFTVQCLRCGEQIEGHVDLRNQLSAEYDGAERVASYFCRKVLMGQQRCFQQIEVEFNLDANRKVIERKITGGKFVDDPAAS